MAVGCFADGYVARRPLMPLHRRGPRVARRGGPPGLGSLATQRRARQGRQQQLKELAAKSSDEQISLTGRVGRADHSEDNIPDATGVCWPAGMERIVQALF